MATAYATDCDDVERMLMLKEPEPTTPVHAPSPAPTEPPGNTGEPEIRVSRANTGQLGHQSRLQLLELISRAKAKGLFPVFPKIVRCRSHLSTKASHRSRASSNNPTQYRLRS